MMTRRLLWFIPVFLLGSLIAQPSYADNRELGHIGTIQDKDGNISISATTVQAYWDAANKEMSIQTTTDAGNIKATIQGNGQTMYNETLTPGSFRLIPLWQTPAGAYKLTLTDSQGNQLIIDFVIT